MAACILMASFYKFLYIHCFLYIILGIDYIEVRFSFLGVKTTSGPFYFLFPSVKKH